MPGSEEKSVRAGPKDVRGKTPHEGGKSPSRPPVDHLLLVLGVGRAQPASRLPQPLSHPVHTKNGPSSHFGLAFPQRAPSPGGEGFLPLRAVPPFMSLGPTRPWAPGLLCTLGSLFSLFTRRKRKGPFPASVGFLPEPQSVPVHPFQAEVITLLDVSDLSGKALSVAKHKGWEGPSLSLPNRSPSRATDIHSSDWARA